MPNPLPSYGKIWNLGHRNVRDIFIGSVTIQEKMDGSQFSFGVRDGELHMRSKGAVVHVGAEPKQFKLASETVQTIFKNGGLTEGWTYRGEAITSPRHNHLTYDRIPRGGIILFDIDRGMEDMADYDWLCDEAERLGLEVVPQYQATKIENIEHLNVFLERETCLGGPKIEGIVIKPVRPMFDERGDTLRAKLVSAEFREKAGASWKAANPGKAEIVEQIIEKLTTEARWRKAVQARADAGELDGSPKDIGPLIGAVQKDVFDEEADQIKEVLFKYFWKNRISRGVTRGFAEWYKAQLLELQEFGESEEE
jgi:hypothetical protein